MKKAIAILCLAAMLTCTACQKQEPKPEPAPTQPVQQEQKDLLSFTDFRGTEITYDDEVTVLPGFAYGRKTVGFFHDTVKTPEDFDENKNYIGKEQIPLETIEYLPYKSYTNREQFGITVADCPIVVNSDGTSEPPYYQKLMVTDVKLKGVLRLVSTDDVTGSAYAFNEWAGDVFFYPYPETMGDFPFIDVGGNYTPLAIEGERSDYTALADTVRIHVGNLNKKGSFDLKEGLTAEDVAALFENSDLVEGEVAFHLISMEYNYDAPTVFETRVSAIEKIGDL